MFRMLPPDGPVPPAYSPAGVPGQPAWKVPPPRQHGKLVYGSKKKSVFTLPAMTGPPPPRRLVSPAPPSKQRSKRLPFSIPTAGRAALRARSASRTAVSGPPPGWQSSLLWSTNLAKASSCSWKGHPLTSPPWSSSSPGRASATPTAFPSPRKQYPVPQRCPRDHSQPFRQAARRTALLAPNPARSALIPMQALAFDAALFTGATHRRNCPARSGAPTLCPTDVGVTPTISPTVTPTTTPSATPSDTVAPTVEPRAPTLTPTETPLLEQVPEDPTPTEESPTTPATLAPALEPTAEPRAALPEASTTPIPTKKTSGPPRPQRTQR